MINWLTDKHWASLSSEATSRRLEPETLRKFYCNWIFSYRWTTIQFKHYWAHGISVVSQNSEWMDWVRTPVHRSWRCFPDLGTHLVSVALGIDIWMWPQKSMCWCREGEGRQVMLSIFLSGHHLLSDSPGRQKGMGVQLSRDVVVGWEKHYLLVRCELYGVCAFSILCHVSAF